MLSIVDQMSEVEVRIKDTIIEEMDGYGKAVVKDLGIDMPEVKLEYDPDSNSAGFTPLKVEQEIIRCVGVEGATEVRFNIPVIARATGLSESDRYIRAYVRQLIAHELRHVWQSYHNKQLIIDQLNEGRFKISSSEGLLGAEVDANEYALSTARGDYEIAVFKLVKECHELDGLIVPDVERKHRINRLVREIHKMENPNIFTRAKKLLFG